MDDDTHIILCKEFVKIANRTNTKSANDLLTIIDSNKYKDIFSYNNSSYQSNLIRSIYYMSNLDHNIVKDIITHIITTRKIANVNNVITIISYYLNTESNIAQFFSFYNNDEITDFVNYTSYDIRCTCFIHNQHAKLTTIFLCVKIKNKLLFNYLLQYMATHNMSIIINISYKFLSNCLINMSQPCYHYYYVMINDHEDTIIYWRSLRNAWIMSCITYIK